MQKAGDQYSALEAVKGVLAQMERLAKRADFSYHALISPPELPMDALAQNYSLTRLDTAGASLPSLLADDGSGTAQVEICPFGPLALITGDGTIDTDPLALLLSEAQITPLFASDLDTAGLWHGAPLARWLFPAQLSEALALFDTLR